MIKRLHIRNYAIIDSLEIDFAEGLTIITGETGAGKSILLGGLNLILGGRADGNSLYDPEKKCVIEGRFELADYDLRTFFQQNDLDYEPELIIRREITPSGKSRAFINDTPVNLKVLAALSNTLIDLHRQFDTLHINSPEFQLQLLDALAGQQPAVDQYRTDYRRYAAVLTKLRQFREQSSSALREMEFLEFQLEELLEADLSAGELEILEDELSRLANADEIVQVAAASFRYLVEDEQSMLSQLQDIGQQLAAPAKVDSRVAEIYERYQNLTIELEEIGSELERVSENTESDPTRQGEVQARVDLIYKLQTKHQVKTLEELLVVRDELQDKVDDFSDMSGKTAALEKEEAELLIKLNERGEELRQKRQTIGPDFTQRVAERLADLAMGNARLEVEFTPLDDPGPSGLDEVRFLFSANRGGRLQTIRDAASGGEMSRLALVTKSLVASAMALPTLIFDEIDSGISGDVALQMGKILEELSSHHQVVVITHSPQVAGRAHRHYFVYKTDKQDENRTVTRVRRLNDEERVRAIATMLSQSPPSESALENARELIG